MFTKGQSGELEWATSSNIPSPLDLFKKILPLVYLEAMARSTFGVYTPPGILGVPNASNHSILSFGLQIASMLVIRAFI